ncbi:MAG: IMP dehydrogenase [Nitrospinota bacterium]|jgi:IMP dehydrogenase|nr:IMP dehydrogenase [Nitrospinota bacterium]MDP6618912.1 IMP dehydrogenase [Nitrospinota bacterium]
MTTNGTIPEMLTFDDVMLLPGRSAVLPRDVDLTTRLTRDLTMNIPLLSAAMDTVTEARLAVALAQEGGIGVIHRNLSPERQAEEVDKVKRSESGMIRDPITLGPNRTVREAQDLMARFQISGVPIVEGEKLAGILTNRDLRFVEEEGGFVREYMTRENLVTAPVGTTLEQAKALLQKNRIEKLPVVDEAFRLQGLITIKDILKRKQYPRAFKDGDGRLRVGAAVGTGLDTHERVRLLAERGADLIVVDTAHGHSEAALRTVGWIKGEHPDLQVVGGNVATPEGTEDLIRAGADAVKVGVGPGSICTTRMVAGVGVPQFSAVSRCTERAVDLGAPVIADGGVKCSGDIVKALAAGADSVMIGSLFAGVDESPGKRVLYQGRSYKVYRGMGSLGAMAQGSAERYGQAAPANGSANGSDGGGAETEGGKLVPEGVEGRVPYRGPMADNVHQLTGGVAAGMGYCGCRTLPELRETARFCRITSAGLRESHVHDIEVTQEAPNYRRD